MTESDEHEAARAEAAFTRALSRAAEDYVPATLDAGAAARRARRAVMARLVAAAAAVVVVMGGTAYAVVQWQVEDGRSGSPATPGPATSGPTPSGSATSAGDPLADPPEGWHWESTANMAVQVPNSWAYDSGPSVDWCAFRDEDFPNEPYIEVDSLDRGFRAIGCGQNQSPAATQLGLGSAPERLWAPHVGIGRGETSEAHRPDGTYSADGWTLIIRTVGKAYVTVLADAATLEIAEAIASSARVVEVDPRGCDVSSPIQIGRFPRTEQPFDVVELADVDSIAVCQYALGVPEGQPGLHASHLLDGEAADRELAAIKAAPVGGGPNTPDTCLHDWVGDSAIVLRLTSGNATYDIHVFYGTCIGNGFDDGTTRRALTLDSCSPLWAGRVSNVSGSMAPYQACHR